VAPGDGGTPPGEALPKPKPEDKGSSAAPGRARLIVELPADGKLYIDDRAIANTTGTRSFNTPELEPDQLYYYMVRVEVMRDGKPVSEERRVIVRAGEVAKASFAEVGAAPVSTAKAR
jgi:uncharacterized protein (TIGR03000 family)